ncbi:hypothetical protein B6U57_06180 [Ligilactobacillus salivarius]|uniref:helix-turn-helix domain-containing protein n=1 Tax=Ligilactobacillus salivarius TaxID=1624 RepID=UPI0009DA4C9A|nr:helix-turn-helix transcriptional regulator [Ligilactobacillus salivarius]OQQ87435.1 hypothetical protein B6U57_06180 [Ligilactobacillus salivarius]
MIEFRLNLILKEKGLSQNQFAKKAGIRPNTVNNIVNNKTKRIEIETINRILDEISDWGYDISDLIVYRRWNNK